MDLAKALRGIGVRGSISRLRIGVLVIWAGLAGGCSTMIDIAGVPHAGHQADGSYVLLTSEQNLDCQRLNEQVEIALKDMEKAKASIDTERNEAPKTLVGVYGRLFGGADGGLNNAENYRKSEQRVRALNGQLSARGCKTVDVDGRIMAFDLAPMNTASTSGTAEAPATVTNTQSGRSSQSLSDISAKNASGFTPVAHTQ